nr:MAG TPA: hypothetical protein [Caudoviricetes sp.]
MDLRNYTEKQLLELNFYFISKGNLNAATYVNDYRKFFGKTVEVVKGRKVPKGIKGVVFWLKRQCYGKYGDPWGIYSTTRCGLKTEEGTVYWTDIKNLELI